VQFTRSSGILLHPTSLPGPYGIGSVGTEAKRFVDFLAECGQSYWQILPLVPTGYGNCPYMSYSAFAGNPLLIDPEGLVGLGLIYREDLEAKELTTTAGWGHSQVNFDEANAFKVRLLTTACENFGRLDPEMQKLYKRFCEQEGWWLEDYALFMSLKEINDDLPWSGWDEGIALREAPALEKQSRQLQARIFYYQFSQFLFAQQWSALKRYANEKNIQIIGDLPIYVAADSADVWANPHLFRLDENGDPTFVAGVPPDYFSETGQLWGNPLYDWDAMARSGYQWWINRFKRTLDTVDIVRIDHFRGFESYWEVEAIETTAINGKWVDGPGTDLFDAVQIGLGGLPLIAEDLGIITPAVEALRDHYGFYGMKVLQFAFDNDPNNAHLPHNHTRSTLVYTGTHDNDTTSGWFSELDHNAQNHTRDYLNLRDNEPIHWGMIRLAMASPANVAIVPLQDVLGLGTDSRMNTPSTAVGNWGWRCPDLDTLDEELRKRLSHLTGLYGRWPT
jgi:4-alpha-glucanotransferase